MLPYYHFYFNYSLQFFSLDNSTGVVIEWRSHDDLEQIMATYRMAIMYGSLGEKSGLQFSEELWGAVTNF